MENCKKNYLYYVKKLLFPYTIMLITYCLMYTVQVFFGYKSLMTFQDLSLESFEAFLYFTIGSLFVAAMLFRFLRIDGCESDMCLGHVFCDK